MENALLANVAAAAGTVTLAEGGSTNIYSKDDKKAVDGQYAAVTLVNYDADKWFLFGALA